MSTSQGETGTRKTVSVVYGEVTSISGEVTFLCQKCRDSVEGVKEVAVPPIHADMVDMSTHKRMRGRWSRQFYRASLGWLAIAAAIVAAEAFSRTLFASTSVIAILLVAACMFFICGRVSSSRA